MANNNTYNEDIRVIESAVDFATAATGETENAKDFMINLAGVETKYGINKPILNDEGLPTTFSAFNISPTSYYSMIEDSKIPEIEGKISNINNAFKNYGYGEDFDIRNVASVAYDETSASYKYSDIDKNYINDPYVGTTIAKHILDTADNPIPKELEDQGTYWAENWTPGGNVADFVNTFAEHRAKTDVEDNIMDMFRDDDDGPFTIQAGDLT
tara:strand:+ start:6591 stop:7229 length:639 start_codon:yes stop_codon:yes gene_type:complete